MISLAPALPQTIVPGFCSHFWAGASRAVYIHSAVSLDFASRFDGSCNYMFVRELPDNLFDVIYVGETGNLAARLRNHKKLLPAIALGMTNLHIHVLATTMAERFLIESDLRHALRPPLNEQEIPAE